MSDLVWIKCNHTDWEQLGLPSLSETIRDPPPSVCRPVAQSMPLSTQSQPQTVLQPVDLPSFPHEHKVIQRPKWLNGPSRISNERSSFLLRQSPRDSLNNRSNSPPGQSPSQTAVSPKQVKELTKELDRAEEVAKSVTNRIEALKRKAAAVIHVL